jgi:predicted thioredoxin/glutaredoxin
MDIGLSIYLLTNVIVSYLLFLYLKRRNLLQQGKVFKIEKTTLLCSRSVIDYTDCTRAEGFSRTPNNL